MVGGVVGFLKSSNIRIFLKIAALTLSAEMVAAENKIDCDVEFQKILNQGDSFDVRGKILQVEKRLADSCKDTGMYEGRLAELYSLSGDNENALKILDAAISKNLAYEKELRLGYFDILFRQEKFIDAESYADKLVMDYPSWYGGYISIGKIKLINAEYTEAIRYFTESNKLNEMPSAYILLVIAYFNIENYRQSALSMQKAIKLDIDSLSHTQAVCAAAYSLVDLGHKAEAKDLLKKHLSVNPSAKNKPEYQEAVSIIDAIK